MHQQSVRVVEPLNAYGEQRALLYFGIAAHAIVFSEDFSHQPVVGRREGRAMDRRAFKLGMC